jgi:hypothetical protein
VWDGKPCPLGEVVAALVGGERERKGKRWLGKERGEEDEREKASAAGGSMGPLASV